MKKAIIIGSGFSGLSAACFLAKEGWEVTVLEKNNLPGGRARKMEQDGFVFDMGPSWYWMPDIFDRFFIAFGKNTSDYYTLQRLDPSYRVYFKDDKIDIPADYEQLKNLFEQIEKGAGKNLDAFMKEAAYKYKVGMQNLVFKPGVSLTEFLDVDLLRGVLKLDVFKNMKAHVGRFFKDPKLRYIIEFPVLFLGAMPNHIPALYSLMNYADIKLGTWYPQGGMFKIAEGMHDLAASLGVQFKWEHDVTHIQVQNGMAKQVLATHLPSGKKYEYPADVVVGAADYHFIESTLLDKPYRSYTENYWDKRTMAPSCLLFYVGVNKKIPGLQHHSLFFDTDFDTHGLEIYKTKSWPRDPLFYVCAPSVTDRTVAPAGKENLFFLVPVASGLAGDNEALRKSYFDKIIKRFQQQTGHSIESDIGYYKSYGITDFITDYGAYKGNAYGLANTLNQTAILKPALHSKKIKNLYYAGQLTVPGPGVPPSLISGELAAREIIKDFSIT